MLAELESAAIAQGLAPHGPAWLVRASPLGTRGSCLDLSEEDHW
jgi:hypothetical protein